LQLHYAVNIEEEEEEVEEEEEEKAEEVEVESKREGIVVRANGIWMGWEGGGRRQSEEGRSIIGGGA
jgi:hypothetical protein